MLCAGYVETVTELPDAIRIVGWCVPLTGDSIQGFLVRLDGVPLRVRAAELHHESPDIGKNFPWASAATHARFGLEVELTAAPGQHRLLSVTPVGLGSAVAFNPLLAVVRPSLAWPGDDLLKTVVRDYERTALEFLSYFHAMAGLKADSRVVDIGCGIGRMAYGLSAVLGRNGSYVGFDVLSAAIAKADATISKQFPQFAFRHVDLLNPMYNPRGTLDDRSFVFDHPDGIADLVIMTSVITHLMPAATENYLREVARMLADDGTAIITAFAIDFESRRLIEAGRSTCKFVFSPSDGCWCTDPNLKESVVGLDIENLMRWFGAAGLSVAAFHAGGWSGRRPFLGFQDIFVVRKAPSGQ